MKRLTESNNIQSSLFRSEISFTNLNFKIQHRISFEIHVKIEIFYINPIHG